MGVSSSVCINFLYCFCVRKTDSPGNNGAKTLSGIIGTVVIILLIFITGLFLWKSYVKKRKMKTGRGRLHFCFLPQVPAHTTAAHPPHPRPEPLVAFLLHFAAQGISMQKGKVGVGLALGSLPWGKLYAFKAEVQAPLCV